MERHAAERAIAPPSFSGALRTPTVLASTAFIICYVLLDATSLVFPDASFGITPWNPGTGLAWAFILLFGKRYLPLLFVAPFLADVFVFGFALAWWAKLLSAAMVGAVYSAALTILLHPKTRFDPSLPSLRDMGLLMIVALAATGLIALAYVTILAISGDLRPNNYEWALMRFWIGDVIGIAVVAPFLLVHATSARLPQISWEFALQGLAIVLALFAIFGLFGGAHMQLFYMLFLPIIWMGLRRGLEGVTFGLVLTQIGVIIGMQITHEEAASVISLQAVMLVLALTGLAIGVVVSERRRAERQLRLNQEAVSRISRLGSMGEFATAIAHEVNQPLTAVSNYTRLVKRYLEGGTANKEAAIEAATKAVAQVERTAAIIKSLRDLIRLGRSEIGPQSVQRIVRETVEMLEPNLQRTAIELKTRIPKDLPPVLADLVQVEQVLLNLIWNAIEAIGEAGNVRGIVTVSATAHSAGYVEVSVADTGPGFPPDFKDAPVVGPLLSTKPDGLGLGLALSRSIVEGHGGRLTIGGDSRGAVVRFTLRTANEVET
jgi:signal transduction histidine kinase